MYAVLVRYHTCKHCHGIRTKRVLKNKNENLTIREPFWPFP
uniref:Uncharacterized protein n=1 Tax=Anguilla anguilla TaxID=7936 RepID=A0A0E9WFT2_ANGAN